MVVRYSFQIVGKEFSICGETFLKPLFHLLYETNHEESKIMIYNKFIPI